MSVFFISKGKQTKSKCWGILRNFFSYKEIYVIDFSSSSFTYLFPSLVFDVCGNFVVLLYQFLLAKVKKIEIFCLKEEFGELILGRGLLLRPGLFNGLIRKIFILE